jgi:hypothetical protein
MPTVYFDHKMAGPVSTFVRIYLNGNPSREKIEKIG